MLGQKEAVIKVLKTLLPNFNLGVDSALTVLSANELETLKNQIYTGIQAGEIEYSKDKSNSSEVRAYARSMVMNHLKKAKELNGGGHTPSATKTLSKASKALANIEMEALPEELKEFVKTLV